MLRVGLTGGIGSGKSTVADRFAALGVPIIDADVVAREVVAPGTPTLEQVIEAFGEQLRRADGALDRRRLRAEVFADPAQRTRLEALLHPAILAEFRRRLADIKAPYCLLVVPLLIESGWDSEVDRVLVIDATPGQQVARTRERDATTEQEVRAIIATQATRAERLAAADDVIVNDGDLAQLERRVLALHRHYLTLAGTGD